MSTRKVRLVKIKDVFKSFNSIEFKLHPKLKLDDYLIVDNFNSILKNNFDHIIKTKSDNTHSDLFLLNLLNNCDNIFFDINMKEFVIRKSDSTVSLSILLDSVKARIYFRNLDDNSNKEKIIDLIDQYHQKIANYTLIFIER